MKRKILLLLPLVSLALHAQQPISHFQGMLPAPNGVDGTTLRNYFRGIPATPVDESSTGANAAWDFSGVTFNIDHHDYVNTVPDAQTVAQYPACNFQTSIYEDTPDETAVIYADYSNGAFSIIRAEGEIMTLDYTINTAFIGQFPMDYGYLNSDATAGNFTYTGNLGTFQGTFAGTVDSNFDAYGNLTYRMDDGTIATTAVSRLKVTQVSSLSVPFFPDAGTLTQVSYYYFAEDQFGIWPLIRSIQTSLSVPLFGIDQSMLVLEKALDAVLSTATIPTASASVYPNPASNTLWVHSARAIQNVEVFSATGQKAASGVGSSVDVSQLPQGVYTASVKTSSGISHYKFIKR